MRAGVDPWQALRIDRWTSEASDPEIRLAPSEPDLGAAAGEVGGKGQIPSVICWTLLITWRRGKLESLG